MSETIATHAYLPEEHAPDPVISHGDPTPPGKIGIWLFLASEIMFFVAILATYIVIRAGSPQLFARHAQILSKPLAGLNTLVLIFSSLTMALAVEASQKGNRKRLGICLLLTILCGFGFMGIKTIEYSDKAFHRTIVARIDDTLHVTLDAPGPLYAAAFNVNGQVFNASEGIFQNSTPAGWSACLLPLREQSHGEWAATIPAGAAGSSIKIYQPAASAPSPADKPVQPKAMQWSGGVYVFDGHAVESSDGDVELHGYRMPMPSGQGFDIHLISQADVKAASGATEPSEYSIKASSIGTQINYGPWKNIFFASYFTLTGVHGLHVVCGLIPMSILLGQSLRGKVFPRHTEYVGLYWHFVDLVWIFLFPLLYLI